jgi:hypothetical protein
MSFHFGRKSYQALYYLHHNHKVGFNLYSGMLLSWPTGRPQRFEWAPLYPQEGAMGSRDTASPSCWMKCLPLAHADVVTSLSQSDPTTQWGKDRRCCPVVKWCPALCDPIDGSTPGSSVLHCLLEFAHIHFH